MESEIERPSFWDIRTGLLSSIDFAEDYALRHPEHADAVTHFSQEIRRIKKEFMSLFEDSFHPAPLHDIVVGLDTSIAMATIMAERHPERSGPLSRVTDDLSQARQEFFRKVRSAV